MRTITEIIERKSKGIEANEEDKEQIKEWLNELRAVGEQQIEADIQTHFTKEYSEWLDEEEDWTQDYSKRT